jgi:hypothetical protein
MCGSRRERHALRSRRVGTNIPQVPRDPIAWKCGIRLAYMFELAAS